MNAIQFIKDHGVDKAREVVEDAPSRANHYCADNYWSWDGIILKRSAGDGFFIHSIWGASDEWVSKAINISDLKRLVESVDLVELLGGIESLKGLVDISNSPFALSHITREGVIYSIDEIKKAIADYEAIYSGVEQ